ncbi:MAG: hypothetical protein WKH64_10100 [Chloroflexia bacterium]
MDGITSWVKTLLHLATANILRRCLFGCSRPPTGTLALPDALERRLGRADRQAAAQAVVLTCCTRAVQG